MSVNSYTRGYAIGVVEDDVGGFPSHAGQFEEFRHGLGDLAVEFLHEELAAGFEVFGFVVVEAGGVDVGFEGFDVGVSVVFWGVVFFE